MSKKSEYNPFLNYRSSLKRRKRYIAIKKGLRPVTLTDTFTCPDTLDSVVLHPTKGFRRVCGKRIKLHLGMVR